MSEPEEVQPGDDENAMLVVGALAFACQMVAALDVVQMGRNGDLDLDWNELAIRLEFMKSQYRITVTRIPDIDPAEEPF